MLKKFKKFKKSQKPRKPKLEAVKSPRPKFGASIKVVGVGGSGSNAIDYMVKSGVSGVDFIVVDCDAQDLYHSKAEKKIHIGKNLTHGLGAGTYPHIGRQAAEENKDELQDVLKGADLVFITCGLGGGTGTGASRVIAEIARNRGSLTIAVVTTPFSFEGAPRMKVAEEGLKSFAEVVDTAIVIPNDRLLETSNKKTTLADAFALSNEVLKNAVQGISDLITKPGIINVDFADIKAIIAEPSFQAKLPVIGIGRASGANRAVEAAKKAINSPLLGIPISGAGSILFAVAFRENLTLSEVNEAAKVITGSADPEAKIIFGVFKDENLKRKEINITLIAAGFIDQSSKTISEERTDVNEVERNSSVNDFDEGNISIPTFFRKKIFHVLRTKSKNQKDHS